MRPLFITICLLFFASGLQARPYLMALGTAQDGGYPHMGCDKEGCRLAWAHDSLRRYVVSLALVDSAAGKWWLFEATPDIKYQLQLFKTLTRSRYSYLPAGIFITHAHMGHYTGLMELGREVMDTKAMPVYVLPKLKTFLETNGPWSQLVKLNEISLHTLSTDSALVLNERISIQAFTVPHRDEYSETAGFKIITPEKKYLFIPDINKWEKWDKSIKAEVEKVDIALVDATFYSGDELPNRKISEVPHPLVTETMALFKDSPAAVKARVVFIHFNHTNPILWDSKLKQAVKEQGFGMAEQGMRW